MDNSKPKRIYRPEQPEHRAWRNMRARCYNPKSASYAYYGERGITVCDEWLKSFDEFFDHVGPRPSVDHSIDRINNDGNYEPGNVRWATTTEQNRNMRHTLRVTFRGETLCVAEWAKRVGVIHCVMKKRIRKWGIERAITTPRITKMYRTPKT